MNEITVTGCGDCPMYHDIEYYCSHPDHKNEQGYLFDNCPLPTDSITIKLEQNLDTDECFECKGEGGAVHLDGLSAEQCDKCKGSGNQIRKDKSKLKK